MEQLSWKIKKSEILWPTQKDDLGTNTVSLTVRIPKIDKLASFPKKFDRVYIVILSARQCSVRRVKLGISSEKLSRACWDLRDLLLMYTYENQMYNINFLFSVQWWANK